MSAQLPLPSSSAGAGTSDRAASRGKLSSAQLDVVDKSCAPNIPSRVQHGSAPLTPSSVNRVNSVNQRSTEKLHLQAMATVAEKTLSPINGLNLLPALPPFVERVVGGDNVTGGEGEDKGSEVSVNENQTTVVRPASMFNTDVQGNTDDPFFCCTANHLC